MPEACGVLVAWVVKYCAFIFKSLYLFVIALFLVYFIIKDFSSNINYILLYIQNYDTNKVICIVDVIYH